MTIKVATYKLSLPLIPRIKAEEFRVKHGNPLKAKQVYLNSLAVIAVNYYLNFLGWATNLEGSNSWNFWLQTMMDVADLEIPNYGKIECRFVLSNQNRITLPADISCQRLAYIIVRLNNSLTEAELLGFIPQINSTELALSDLKPITQLPAYLSQYKRSAVINKPTKLSQWLEGLVENSWHQLEELFSPSMKFNFRNFSPLKTQNSNNLFPGVSRVKLIDLEDPENNHIALILTVFAHTTKELDISVKVCPGNKSRYLPQGLELVILDLTKKPIMQAQANHTETIEFCFTGELGEDFAIEVSLDDYIKVESFIV
ncbi:MAG: DUF1822 family protein [Pleurocapsa sp.]